MKRPIVVAALMVAAACSADPTPTGVDASIPSDGGPLLTESAKLAGAAPGYPAPNTFFISGVSVLQSRESRVIATFTPSRVTTYILRSLADYTAVTAVIPANQTSAFLSGGSVSTYKLLNGVNSSGQSVTLNPGSYAVVIRNMVAADNRFDIELDYDTSMPATSTARFTRTAFPLTFTDNLTAHSRASRAFTVRAGYRYWIDGGNSGNGSVYTCIAPASQVQAFLNNQTFSCLKGTVDVSGGGPGGLEIVAAPGSYAVLARNDGNIPVSWGAVLEEWAVQKR